MVAFFQHVLHRPPTEGHSAQMLYRANDGPVLHTSDLSPANIPALIIYHKRGNLQSQE